MLFTTLTLEPFFMIDCTETDGNNHLENVFNECTTASSLQMDHSSQNGEEIYLAEHQCKCRVEIADEEFLILNIDKIQLDGSQSAENIKWEEPVTSARNFQTNKTESHPISINLVESEVILI